MARILDETDHLLRLYQHHAGQSEVPTVFHVWCCLALTAACLGDRVWYHKFRGSKLYPNLYVMLLGPSGCGKGEAINAMLNVMPRATLAYQGRATKAHLVDHLAKLSKNGGPGAKVFLITPELLQAVGEGPVAHELVTTLTDWYHGKIEYRDGTRTHGEKILRLLLPNWIAGTTREWLMKTVSVDEVKGGFFGRIVAIEGMYAIERFRRPLYPDDYDEIVAYLRARFRALTAIEGEFVMTAEAEEVEGVWYAERPMPEDVDLIPTWRREHDLLLKLSMLLAVLERSELTIEARHVQQAMALCGVSRAALPNLIRSASTTRDSQPSEVARALIRRLKVVDRTTLMQRLSGKGLNKEKLDRSLSTLITAGEITAQQVGRKWVYEWIGPTIEEEAQHG